MAEAEFSALLGLAALWIGYCVLHSLLASLTVKRWVARHWPVAAAGYRLLFNILAVLLVIPPLWLMKTIDSDFLWRWNGAWGWLANGLAFAAIAGFLWSLRYYDNLDFLGLRRYHGEAAPAGLRLSPLHRWVRHPWYFFALVMIWSRDMDAAFLVTASVLTIYFITGARLEEAKLVHEFGPAYILYQKAVPALVPWPGRTLTVGQAAQLEAMADSQRE